MLRDPKHLMTPEFITDDASQCIHEVFLKYLSTGKDSDSYEQTR